MWAPEIHFVSNQWYVYYSLAADPAGANHRVYVAQSQTTSAAGPYTSLGVLFNDYWNIDGSVFTATNGQLYFIFSGSPAGTQNIYIAPMSNPYTLSGPPVMISQPTLSWKTSARRPRSTKRRSVTPTMARLLLTIPRAAAGPIVIVWGC